MRDGEFIILEHYWRELFSRLSKRSSLKRQCVCRTDGKADALRPSELFEHLKSLRKVSLQQKKEDSETSKIQTEATYCNEVDGIVSKVLKWSKK